MISALLYLQWYSVWNRTKMRIKRLKQPKYLLFAFVGGLYFYFYFFRHFIGRSLRQNSGTAAFFGASPETLALFELLGALFLFLVMLLAWVIPHERAALIFTEAEIAFLFPAPITRRGLIHYKLLRSQFAILFSNIILALLTRRFATHFWLRVGGLWIILFTLNLHFIGSSFARTMLLDRGVSNWKRRVGALALVLTAVGLVIWWAKRTMPSVSISAIQSLDDFKDYIQNLLLSGPALYILYPFRMIVRPFLSPDPVAFLMAVGPAVAILLVHYWWVIRSDVAFEEASIAASQKLAVKVAAIRSGNWRAASKPVKAKKAPFQLGPTGFQPIALFWKNLISAGSSFSPRTFIVLALVAAATCMMLRVGSAESPLLPALSMISAGFVVWTLLLGPQVIRHDLRNDLPRADMLKMYPMRGWQIVFGELLAPTAILTGIQWFLLIISVVLSATWPGRPLSLSLRLGLGFSAALLVPLLNLITLQIPNGAVLLLPAWFAKDAGHGIEVAGQRIVSMLASLVVFILSLLPAAAAYIGVLLLSRLLFSFPISLVFAAVAAAIVLAAEAAVGIMLLGSLFERYDVSAESNP